MTIDCEGFSHFDIERIDSESNQEVKPSRDDHFRLVCAAAIAPNRKSDGTLNKEAISNHVGRLVDESIDAIAISTAHGFTKSVGEIIEIFKRAISRTELNCRKRNLCRRCRIFSSSRSQCHQSRTRTWLNLHNPSRGWCWNSSNDRAIPASQVAKKSNVTILADGGISKSGDIVKALTLSDAVICGSLLAGCNEAPGRIIEINGKLYKQYRGMGSREAMKEGSAARYGHTKKEAQQKAAAEGIEALKESAGSLSNVLNELVGGIQSGMGYLGASDLKTLRKMLATYESLKQDKRKHPHTTS